MGSLLNVIDMRTRLPYRGPAQTQHLFETIKLPDLEDPMYFMILPEPEEERPTLYLSPDFPENP